MLRLALASPTAPDLQRALEDRPPATAGLVFEPLVYGTGLAEYRIAVVDAAVPLIERPA